MTLRAICKREMERIPRNLAGGPDNPSDLRGYVDAFERHCANETHAKRVIDSLIETCQFYPRIAEIVTMCKAIDPLEGGVLPPGCAKCGGEAWVAGEINGHECAMRCDCERGKYLRARDRERRVA
jgi:hypothetical protein